MKDMAKCGAKTEIWSRVTGYFRPVRQWNKGKKEEFKDRVTYVNPELERKAV
jgi:anaerobic ribonucleoside-triphosphate reductase